MDKLETLEELFAGRHDHYTALRLGEMGRGCQAGQVGQLGAKADSFALQRSFGGGHGGGQR